MMKRLIVCLLCLLVVSSSCLAEGTPVQVSYCQISMYPEIPEKTMKALFEKYMVPGCEAEYNIGSACCPALCTNGEGGASFDGVVEDNEQIAACREIAGELLRTVYPGSEMELVTATTYRAYMERTYREWYNLEQKDGQWFFLGKPLTKELKGILTATHFYSDWIMDRIEKVNPSWILLQYHPGSVCGLPVALSRNEEGGGATFCMNYFIFDADQHIVSAGLDGSFSVMPGEAAEIVIQRDEALRMAQDLTVQSNQTGDWITRVDPSDPYDMMLQELGYSSIQSRMVPGESVRMVMTLNPNGQLQPAWECSEGYDVMSGDEMIQEHRAGIGDFFFYLSAENGDLVYAQSMEQRTR